MLNGKTGTVIYPFFMENKNDLISGLEKLARLQLSEAEHDKLGADLNNILQMVEQLRSLDTSGVEPLVYLNEPAEHLAEDEVSGQLPREAALRNAPRQDGQFFRTPKVK